MGRAGHQRAALKNSPQDTRGETPPLAGAAGAQGTLSARGRKSKRAERREPQRAWRIEQASRSAESPAEAHRGHPGFGAQRTRSGFLLRGQARSRCPVGPGASRGLGRRGCWGDSHRHMLAASSQHLCAQPGSKGAELACLGFEETISFPRYPTSPRPILPPAPQEKKNQEKAHAHQLFRAPGTSLLLTRR